MRKQLIIVVVLLVLVFGGLFGGKWYAGHRTAVAAAHRSMPPTSVSTAVARIQPWSPETSVVGSLEAVSGTEITAQIAGNVTAIAFRSGARVAKGALLVRLDDSSQMAQLHADAAKLALARTTLARTQKLFAAHADSQSDLQSAEAGFGTASAAVEGDQAVLRKLNIAAPFAGVVGIREVSLGQYVSPGTSVVDLQSDDPMLLDFTLPQSTLAELADGDAVAFHTNAYAGKAFLGKVTAIGSRIDPSTRNISVQATLPNPDGRLRPGLYGDVQLTLGQARRGVVVPATALTFSTFGDNVYVVRKQADGTLTVHAEVVHVSDQHAGLALIASGLAEGDVVVTAGQNKLHDGATVAVDNSVQP
ncbi:MAG TPA: efflux RND transporter periplasmic adaptor subunit [Rhodanobacteraceae bacterium]|nr:efflux RND transporter periplasmic adaptor subunit [Rhodanobacteraceae bacterium]